MENIQSKMKELFGNSCYAYCLAYKFANARTIKDLTSYVLDGWYDGYIDDDGYVSKPVQYINNTCKAITKVIDVEKPNYKKQSLVEDLNIIMFEYNNGTHFVVVDKEGDVVFDPSGDSKTVKYGIPVSIRKFITK